MPTHIKAPTIIEASGNKPKIIRELIGRVNSGHANISVAHMTSLAGWVEPAQTPEFDEYTVVIRGLLRVSTDAGDIDVTAGQAIITYKDERVKYSTPGEEGADYIAICLPAFSPNTVHRDE